MAYKAIVSKRATRRLLAVLDYLKENWGEKVAIEFADKVQELLNLLENQPFIGAPSNREPTVRRILVTKHNRVYYRIKGNAIIIVHIIDTRQHPRKNKYE